AGVDVEGLAERRPEISEELKEIIRRATAVNPDRRYTSAAAFERAISHHLGYRFPTFTVSAVAEIVRAHAKGVQVPELATAKANLLSITRSDVVPSFDRPSLTPGNGPENRVPQGDELEPVRGTRTMGKPQAPHPRRLRVGSALVAVLVAGTIGWTAFREL